MRKSCKVVSGFVLNPCRPWDELALPPLSCNVKHPVDLPCEDIYLAWE